MTDGFAVRSRDGHLRPGRLTQVVFIVHGLVTFAAAIVLVAVPGLIPATIGVDLEASHYVLSYFLAAAELAIAVLSIGACWLTDPSSLILIAWVFVVFHLSTAALEIGYLSFSGMIPVLVGNIAVRAVAAVLFAAIAVDVARRRSTARAQTIER
ncbi:MAG: hypothetical protein ABWX65_12960 [Mycetocola sp.]